VGPVEQEMQQESRHNQLSCKNHKCRGLVMLTAGAPIAPHVKAHAMRGLLLSPLRFNQDTRSLTHSRTSLFRYKVAHVLHTKRQRHTNNLFARTPHGGPHRRLPVPTHLCRCCGSMADRKGRGEVLPASWCPRRLPAELPSSSIFLFTCRHSTNNGGNSKQQSAALPSK